MEPYDEGFARNVTRLFGTDLYRGMHEQPVESVTLSPDKERITFSFQDGSAVVFAAEGDCCSRSWIEHLEVPNDIRGQKLEQVSDARVSRDDSGGSLIQLYNTKFITDRGETITIEYRNESNGYYGGYLVRVDA